MQEGKIAKPESRALPALWGVKGSCAVNGVMCEADHLTRPSHLCSISCACWVARRLRFSRACTICASSCSSKTAATKAEVSSAAASAIF
eukprot:6727619-Prorocentrum_lima.AAC.1